MEDVLTKYSLRIEELEFALERIHFWIGWLRIWSTRASNFTGSYFLFPDD